MSATLECEPMLSRNEVERLRTLMPRYLEEHQLSQRELGEKLGVKANTISTFLAGGLKRPGEWLGVFQELVSDWAPANDDELPHELLFDSKRILEVLGKAARSGRVDVLERIGNLHRETEDLLKRAYKARQELMDIADELEKG